jgi:sigma-E factor negative regulatory protein RseB
LTPTSCSLVPRDNLRFGYRIWSEKKSGLVVKLQTLDADGQVIEQAAFSELQLDAPVKMDKLAQMMASTDGYKVEKGRSGQDHGRGRGLGAATPVAGFKPMGCYKRPTAAGGMPTKPCNGSSRTGWLRSRCL